MDYRNLFKEKLSKLLFLELNKEGFLKALNISNLELKNKELFVPINTTYLASNIENEIKIKNLPIYDFIEGMSFALGADDKLKFNEDYITLLKNIKDSIPCIKSAVAKKIKENLFDEAYILLRGLTSVTNEEEVWEKLFLIGETIREQDKGFTEVFKEDIDRYKNLNPNSHKASIYEALIYNDEGNNEKAYVYINEYLNYGGEPEEYILSLKAELEDTLDYENGKKLIEGNPKEALKKLIPLLDRFGDNPSLFYYVALCYRKLENYEKAIYYLNESIAIDSSIVETINEMGINYASLEDFENAIKYFRKAFEATRDIEICTNLIMCYLNSGDLKQARLHLEIAEKINKDDEIVKEIKEYMKRFN